MDNPTPVAGTLTRTLESGEIETLSLTPDEITTAPERYSSRDCANILVTYSDGTESRPFRFVESNPAAVFSVRDDGTRVCSI